MDEFKEKKELLIGLKKKIALMSDNKKKSELIEGYCSLYNYIKDASDLSVKEMKKFDLELEDLTKFYKRIHRDTSKKLDELSDCATYIKDKFQKIIDEYKKNDICSYERGNYYKVNIRIMSEYMNQFFETLGTDVYNLYQKMSNAGNISMIYRYETLGVSLNAITIDNPCILLDDIEKYVDFYFTFVHEMGHCYQFYLQQNHFSFETFNVFDEVTSLLFEKLFSGFLANKKLYKKELREIEIEDHLYFLNDISAAKVLCGLIEKDEILSIDTNNLRYVTPYSHLELLGRMVKDCGYIYPNKLDLSFNEFHYSIGNVIANYFYKRISENFIDGWKEFKNFICTANYLPLKEALDKYFDIDLMRDNIKKFVKSYR